MINKFIVLLLFILINSFPNLYGDINGRKIQAVFCGEVVKQIKLYNIAQDEYFSISDIADIYGAHLVWHPITGKVTFLMNNRKLDIYIKSTKIFIGEKKKRISIPTRFISNELYVPAVFIFSEDFTKFTETTFDWNNETGIFTVERKTNISPPRFYSGQKSTQIVIELMEKLSYTFVHKEPKTVSISFTRGRLEENKVEVNDNKVKSIVSKNNGRLGVIKINIENPSLKVSKKMLNNPLKLVVVVGDSDADEKLILENVISSDCVKTDMMDNTVSTLTATATQITSSTSEQLVIQAPQQKPSLIKRKLIVLDAGHGGQDPGAVGHNGTKEKGINLAIVKEVQRLFEEDKNSQYDILLTRNDDTFVPLVERTSLANEKNADLFVSIHCNADFGKSASGFEVYFLSEKASDAEAAATALLENSVVKLEGKPTKKRAKLQELLWSLMVNEFINESSEVCSYITNEVTKRIKIENRGVKQAEFYVLRGADMPAVLIECAFISHYGEEARLRNKRFQYNVADAVYEAIKKYDARKDLLNGKNKKTAKQ